MNTLTQPIKSEPVKRNKQFWSDHVSQWKASSVTQARYCRDHNLDQNSFSYHKNKQLIKPASENSLALCEIRARAKYRVRKTSITCP